MDEILFESVQSDATRGSIFLGAKVDCVSLRAISTMLLFLIGATLSAK